MHRKELIKRELDDLDILSSRFAKQVEETLEKIRKSKCRLWLTKQDKYRLLVLRTWTLKYKIDLNYILSKVLPFWEQFVQRKSKKMRKEGLNVRVSTLTGKKSEQYLQDCLKKDFPNNEQVFLWKAQERSRLIKAYKKQDQDDGIKVKERGIEDKSLRKYVVNYRHRVRRENKELEKIEKEFLFRPHRMNPFRETV